MTTTNKKPLEVTPRPMEKFGSPDDPSVMPEPNMFRLQGDSIQVRFAAQGWVEVASASGLDSPETLARLVSSANAATTKKPYSKPVVTEVGGTSTRAFIAKLKGVRSMALRDSTQLAEELVTFLEETLIPDLDEMGATSTAKDFDRTRHLIRDLFDLCEKAARLLENHLPDAALARTTRAFLKSRTTASADENTRGMRELMKLYKLEVR